MLSVFHISVLTASMLESVAVRNFSLLNQKKENVLQPDFDRRRLSDSFATRSLTLQFDAVEKHFEFEFQRSRSIFARGTTIKISGRVRLYCRAPVLLWRAKRARAHIYLLRA